jgi:hypothetical protein
VAERSEIGEHPDRLFAIEQFLGKIIAAARQTIGRPFEKQISHIFCLRQRRAAATADLQARFASSSLG